MKHTFVVAVAAFSSLCVAPAALMFSAAMSSAASAGDERPQDRQAVDWTRFSPTDRASCLSLIGASGTYTDLLKCLAIKRDASVAKQSATVGKGQE